MSAVTVHPVDERLPGGRLAVLGLQHVLVMNAGAVAVPLIVGRALNLTPEQVALLISADLFVSGIVTLIQSLGMTKWFGIKLPVMMGVTFAAVGPMVAFADAVPGVDGARAIFGAVIGAGLVSVAIAPIVSKLLRLFPPVVTGTIITIIGNGAPVNAGATIHLQYYTNLLAREQHGDMLAVGFEMYVELLDEAIRGLKKVGAEEVEVDPVLDVKYRGFIPVSYIDAERLRIEVYKRLASLKSEEELRDLLEELGDRYGPLPSELQELFRVVEIKVLCRNVGVKLLTEKESELLLNFEKSKVDIIRLIQKINRNKRLFNISPKDYNTLTVYRGFADNSEKLSFLKDLFDYGESA